jgi:hypothetical protein
LNQKKQACFESKAGSGKKFLTFFCYFEEINVFKRYLKHKVTASSKKRKDESLLLNVSYSQASKYISTIN